MSEHLVAIHNVPTKIFEQGSGFPLLVLHGWGVSSLQWQEPAELLANSDYRVIVPDLPGFGESDPPPAAWSVDDYVEWTKDLVAQFHLENYALLGHSFGGRIAIKLAASQPDNLQSLALCAAAGLKSKDVKKRAKKLLFNSLARAGKKGLALGKPLGLEKPARKLVYKLAHEHDYEQAEGVMRQVLQKAIAEDLRACLSHITIPTLIVWGDQDTFTPVKDAYEIHETIAGSELQIIEGSKHNVYRKQAKEFCRVVSSFLGRSATAS